jgi:phage-related protein (TIGR01555 family)
MSLREFVTDGFVNLLTGLGVVGKDPRQSAYGSGPMTWSREEMDNLYSGDDMIRRICDLPAKTMTRKWLQIHGVDDPQAAADILEAGRKLGIKKSVKQAITWARLHGSALVIMVINDGRPMDEPVNEERIQEIEALVVLDRWDLQIESVNTEFGANFNKPETYQILFSAATSITGLAGQEGASAAMQLQTQPIVHASRVLRFDGVETPKQRKRDLQGWNDSAITSVYDVVRDFSMAYSGTAISLGNMGTMLYKIKELSKRLAADKDNLVLQRLMLMNQAKSAVNMIPLDADGESVEPMGNPLSGAKELLERWDVRLAGALGWPVTVLMGRSPAGMNATGENDLAIFYDTMEGDQDDLTEPVERFYRYLQKSKRGPTKGKELEGWAVKWNTLWQESQGEQAKTRLAVAQADALNIDRDVYTAEEAANSHYAGDEFSVDIQLDTEAREADKLKPAEEIPGMELRPNPEEGESGPEENNSEPEEKSEEGDNPGDEPKKDNPKPDEEK